MTYYQIVYYFGCGVWLIQTLNQNRLVELSELASANKKSVIRVLHVDDDPSILEISKQIMIDMDSSLEFDGATCVDEALRKLSTGQYDVVVSDYEMPQKDGLKFLKELREGKNEIPFILFTGKGREEVVIQALNLGADNYVNKQGSPETVYSELAHLVSSAVEKYRAKLRNENDSLAFHNVRDAIVSSDANFTITAWNKAAEELFGFGSLEVLQKKIDDVFEKILVKPSCDELMHQLKTTGQFQGEVVCQNKKGQKRNGLINVISLVSENGKFLGNVTVCSDITERKKTEEALLKFKQRIADILESIADYVYALDRNWNFIYVNKLAANHWHYKPEELNGKNYWQTFPKFVGTEVEKNFHEAMSKREIKRFEWKTLYATGFREFTVFPSAEGITIHGKDITKRKMAEQDLKESEEKYRTLFEQAGDYILILETQPTGVPTIFDANTSALQIHGYTREEIIGKPITFLDEESGSKGERYRLNRLPNDEKLTFEARHRRKDGSTIDVEVSIKKVKVGSKDFLVSVERDITERKKMEDALRQDQDMLEAITDNLGAGFVTISKDYRVLYANKFVKNNCGNVEGKQCYATLNTLDHICPDCGVIKVFEDGVAKDSHEYSQIGVNGRPYYVELIATPLKDKDGNVTAALEFVVDIAEKKRMQQELQTNEAKFRAISNTAIDAIFMFDDEDRITYWNPAAERIFGYTEKEIVGKKVDATIVLPSCRKDHLKLTLDLGKIGSTQKNVGEILEVPALRKDGTEFSMEFSLTPLQLNGKQHFVAIARDITERKRAEENLKRTMNKLVSASEKLGVVGNLTRHDVCNKLSAVNSYTYLLKKRYKDQADILEGLSKIEQAVADSKKIFEFAKMYEQLGVEKLTYVDVGQAVDDAEALFEGLTLKVINDCHGRSVLADSFLSQLFYNFIDNTRKYGEKATTIKVHFEKEDSGVVHLIYEDDGVGVPAKNKAKLFTEGFSTGGSTGFGLFLIKKMMDVYGWNITEEGEPGKGAKFTITIPHRSSAPQPRKPT